MSDLIYGTTLADTVSWIVGDALRKNTEDGYREAYHQIHGLDRWLITMRHAAGSTAWGLHDTLALGNEMRRMDEMADRPDLRAAIMERLKA